MIEVIEPLLSAAASEDGITILSKFQVLLTEMISSYEQEFICIIVVLQQARHVGQPTINIHENQLRFLIETRFKIT